MLLKMKEFSLNHSKQLDSWVRNTHLIYTMRLLYILEMQQQGQVMVSFNLVEEDLRVKQLNLEDKLMQQLIMLLVGVIVRVIKVYLMGRFYCMVSVNRRSRRTTMWCRGARDME